MPAIDAETDAFFFDPDVLRALAQRHAGAYAQARPFPHVVLDNLCPEPVAQQIERQFPAPDFEGYRQPDNDFQVNKLGRLQDSQFRGVPAFCRHFLNELNGMVFLDFLEKLTGITGLIPDPHFNGGAMHQILPGGKLAVHADFNRDVRRALDRRVNVLLYFNADWKEEYGGQLELWEQDMSACAARITPLLNRCVIFNTTSTSFHGHPEPLNCPEGMTRKSIAIYYYTSHQTYDGQQAAHSTLWRQRPGEGPVLDRLLKHWVPPAVRDLGRRAVHRIRPRK
jgi:hypothetical protein